MVCFLDFDFIDYDDALANFLSDDGCFFWNFFDGAYGARAASGARPHG